MLLKHQTWAPKLQGVINAIQDRLQLHHMQCSVNIDGVGKRLFLDGEQLHKALLHIVNDAIDAMSSNKCMLRLTLQYTEVQALLTIADNGVGMRDELLEGTFEPYCTQKGKSQGLGQTIALKVIEAHGAQIYVKSTLNEGAVFQIRFPL